MAGEEKAEEKMGMVKWQQQALRRQNQTKRQKNDQHYDYFI